MKVAVLNQSTMVTEEQVIEMTRAVQVQVSRDFAPAWYRTMVKLQCYKQLKNVPQDAWLVTILDDSDQAGALGYHDETPDGRVYGRVFCKDTLTHGGTVLKGSNSVSVTLSHEILELLADPNINLWADNGGNSQIALEVGDPVEATSYEIDGVAVSNFVYQSYFDHQSKVGLYDHLGLIKLPWTMLPGGYLIKRSAGQVTQQFGHEYPDWKKSSKTAPAARSHRRVANMTPGALVN